MSNRTEFVCTKENPFIKGVTVADTYIHPSAGWTDYRSDYVDEYECPICGIVWKEEVGD